MPSKEIVVSIDCYNHDTSIEIAFAAAKEFRVGKNQARLILEEVRSAVSQWRSVASALGISRKEGDRMSRAFLYEKQKLR